MSRANLFLTHFALVIDNSVTYYCLYHLVIFNIYIKVINIMFIQLDT